MKLNPNLKNIFEENGINYQEGVIYLLSLHFNILLPDNVFEQTIKQINFLKMVEKDFINDTLIWNIKLFEESVCTVSNSWEWIDEYRSLFIAIRKDKGGSFNSCQMRMKKFFAENPTVRKDDIIEATKLYIRNLNDPTYLQRADYFIKKDKGSNETSRLEEYLEILFSQRKENSQCKNQMLI